MIRGAATGSEGTRGRGVESREMKRTRRITAFILSAFLLVGLNSAAFSDVRITLTNSWLAYYSDRVLIGTQMRVQFVHSKPKWTTNSRPQDDYDIHIAGTTTTIRMPMIAELMNSQDRYDAIRYLQQRIADGKRIKLGGVCRLWCEHPGGNDHVIGAPIPAITNTNPDHVMEIHPVTRIDDLDLLDTIRTISTRTPVHSNSYPLPPGAIPYQPKTAQNAFTHYNGLRCVLTKTSTTTTISTGTAHSNYVRFKLRKTSPAFPLKDGFACYGNALNISETTTYKQNLRMVLVPGSETEERIKQLVVGQTAEVLGMPRVDLTEVRNQVTITPGERIPLPYEIVVLGIYP